MQLFEESRTAFESLQRFLYLKCLREVRCLFQETWATCRIWIDLGLPADDWNCRFVPAKRRATASRRLGLDPQNCFGYLDVVLFQKIRLDSESGFDYLEIHFAADSFDRLVTVQVTIVSH